MAPNRYDELAERITELGPERVAFTAQLPGSVVTRYVNAPMRAQYRTYVALAKAVQEIQAIGAGDAADA